MRTIVFLAAASVFVASGALAQRLSSVDGTKLLTFCTGKVSPSCDPYLSGVADAFSAGESKKICIPDAVSGNQLRDVVVKFLKDHPGDRELKAGTLTYRAYTSAFSCRK